MSGSDNNNNNNNLFDPETLRVLQGGGLIVFGLFLLLSSLRIMAGVVSFCVGFGFIYYGLMILKVEPAVSYMNAFCGKLKCLFYRDNDNKP